MAERYIDQYDSNKYIEELDNVIIAKGGDGTLLKAIKMHRDKNKPFFGIAAGTENFLMNTSDIIQQDASYEKFNLIKVKVTSSSGQNEYQAFNDVVIGGDMNSYISFNVHDEDKIIGKFQGGGMIISTAQGSTGVNKNNNSSILALGSKNWIISGVLTTRNIRYIIEPKRTTITVNARTPVTVWVDGSNQIIQNVQKIELSKGDEVQVIFNDYDKFKKKRRI